MTAWPEVQTRRLFRIVNGGTPTADPGNWDGDVPWATPVDLGEHNGRILEGTTRTLTARGLETGSGAVPAGSLLLSSRAPIGYVAETCRLLAFNQGCRGLVPLAALDTRFYRYVFASLGSRLQSRGQGSTFVELSSSALAEVPLPWPDQPTQRVIADFLDTETARIDALITKKRRMVDLLDESEQRRFLDSLGDFRMVRSRTLRQYGVSVLTGPFGTVLAATEYIDGGVPLINPSHIKRGKLVPEPHISVPRNVADRIGRHKLAVGDVVMGRKGDVGRCAVVPEYAAGWLCGSDSIAIRCARSSAKPEFIGMALQVDLYRQQLARKSTGATLANVNEGVLLDLQVPDLSREEQEHVMRVCWAVRQRNEALQRPLTSQIGLLREHRQALITAAVTGELAVPGTAA